MNERQLRIELLSRENRGKAARPVFLNGLSSALGETIGADALASLPETDALREKFREAYTSAVRGNAIRFRRFFKREERTAVFRMIDCFADKITDDEILFLTKESEICGAVLMTGGMLKHAEGLLDFDGDSVSILSNSHGQGFLIDFNPDEPIDVYEVTAWGDSWSLMMESCDR
jgi:hypothetical protein